MDMMGVFREFLPQTDVTLAVWFGETLVNY